MAINTIDIGSAIGIHGYDSSVFTKAMTVKDPISGVTAVDPSDYETSGGASSSYLLKGGDYGGQVAYGGLDSSENIQLVSTFHATKGSVVLGSSGCKVGFYNSSGIGKQSLNSLLTSISHTVPSTLDYNIQDLVDSATGSAFGFATKDEGNTVLSVILDLQTQVKDLQNKLTNLGLF